MLGIFKRLFQAFAEILSLLLQYRVLTIEMARREIMDRYAGQAFGAAWPIIHPIFMMGLYVFIFAVVFKVKVGGTVDMPLDYTTYLLSGLVAWLSFQDSLTKSSGAITSNAALVKQVVFPLEILPVKGVLTSLFTLFISLTVLVSYVLISNGSLHLTYFILPFLVLFQVMAMIGFAFILAPVGAYFRDIKDFVQLFSIAGIYMMPIFYLPKWVPDLFQPLLYLNPFSYLIWCYQDVLYYGRIEHPGAWIVIGIGCPLIFVLGYRVFRKLKTGLGNLL
jgi:lipopolysaccharide transport system permease protein